METFRFVDCHPDNSKTFSFELSSILRDAGSIFSSVLDHLVRRGTESSDRLDIANYKKWLTDVPYRPQTVDLEPVNTLELAVAELNAPFDRRFLRGFMPYIRTPRWWSAYNDLKHSDLNQFRKGNLEHCLNAVAALGTLLVHCTGDARFRVFRRIGIFSDPYLRYKAFCTEDELPIETKTH
jgi:hypothetical protein